MSFRRSPLEDREHQSGLDCRRWCGISIRSPLERQVRVSLQWSWSDKLSNFPN